MEITGLNFIGTTRSAKGNRSFKTFNPRLNSQNKWDFFEATSEEINEAVRLAQTAFFALKKIDPLQRATFLREIIRQLEVSKDLILTIYQLETALPLVRAEAEFRRTINQLINFAQLLESGQWPIEIKEPADINRSPIKPSLLKTQIGIGPVVVFGASNFPLAYSTIGGDSVAALAAACPVIVKGHPMHAGTGEIVAKAVIEATQITGMPNGIFSNLNAQDFNVGEQLVLHNGIEAVGFTGSIKGGTTLLKLASTRKKPIPVFAEMGSLNPIILLPSEKDNLQNWAATITLSITNNSGQFCTKPGLLFCLKSNRSAVFLQNLVTQFKQVKADFMVSPVIWDNYNKRIDELKQNKHLQFVATDDSELPNIGKPILATIDGENFLKDSKLQEEVFGPFSLVVVFDSLEDLIKGYTCLEGQLTTSFFGETNQFQEFESLLFTAESKAGRILFNQVPTGVEISQAMHHSGAFPASSDSRFTAVGIDSIARFSRPIVYQNRDY